MNVVMTEPTGNNYDYSRVPLIYNRTNNVLYLGQTGETHQDVYMQFHQDLDVPGKYQGGKDIV